MKLKIYVDGACRGNPGPASFGVCIQDDSGKTVREERGYIGETTNNVAEYTAMLEALRLAVGMGGTELTVHSDSQLMVRQLMGVYRVKNDRLRTYLLKIQNLRRGFTSVEFVHVPREENKRADRLANEALDELRLK
ncbi:ribonuclease HI family protein [Elusimicrobiota bacterium]